MSNATADQAEQTAQPDSTAGQVKEAVGGAVGQVQEQAEQAKGQARQRLSQELSTRSSHAGEQVRDTAHAIRETGQSLRKQGKSGPAQTMDRVADQADRVASYLTEADGNRMLRDVERFARQQPWAFTIGGVVAGFFASRFLKASSTQRYDSGANAMHRSGPSPRSQGALPAAPIESSMSAGGRAGVDR
jgi:ElaB/YqjD/DUF883 family membrane-anchored ribosome-binding protein